METPVLALISHDGKKPDMVAFALRNKAKLSRYRLIATSTTGKMLMEPRGTGGGAAALRPIRG